MYLPTAVLCGGASSHDSLSSRPSPYNRVRKGSLHQDEYASKERNEISRIGRDGSTDSFLSAKCFGEKAVATKANMINEKEISLNKQCMVTTKCLSNVALRGRATAAVILTMKGSLTSARDRHSSCVETIEKHDRAVQLQGFASCRLLDDNAYERLIRCTEAKNCHGDKPGKSTYASQRQGKNEFLLTAFNASSVKQTEQSLADTHNTAVTSPEALSAE